MLKSKRILWPLGAGLLGSTLLTGIIIDLARRNLIAHY